MFTVLQVDMTKKLRKVVKCQSTSGKLDKEHGFVPKGEKPETNMTVLLDLSQTMEILWFCVMQWQKSSLF